MRWLARLSERLFGYAPVGGWRLYPVEANHRRRFSLPGRVPVPREVWSQWPAGERRERLSHAELAEFAARFLEEKPQHWAAREMRRFAGKAVLAKRVEQALREAAWDDAVGLLEQILSQDPDDGRAHFLLALCRLSSGRIEEAAAELDAAAPQMEIDADYRVARGRVAEHREDLDTARGEYRAALALQEGHPVALERLTALGELVEIYLGDLDQPEKAYLTQEDYAEFIAKGWDAESHDGAFFLERSRFHLISGQPELALRAAERAQAAWDAQFSRGAAPDAELAADGLEVQIIEARCRALLAPERFDDAEQSVAQLEERAPGCAAALSLRGQLLWFRGQRAEAAAIIRRALEADPSRPENVRLYLDPDFPRETRDLQSAIKELMRRYPESWAVQWIAASVSMASGDWAKGVAAALASAAAGASEEALIELSGRLGRAERFAEVARLCEAAGGWRRFLDAHPLLRGNLAAGFGRCEHSEAAGALWQSLVDDASAHPDLRLRAREALGSTQRETGAGAAR